MGFRQAGSRGTEGVALWLGRRDEDQTIVSEVYVPDHEAYFDYFRIPPSSMSALLRHLGETQTFIAAQVHSHPKYAFHSLADDRWAIVRHLGALSLVVPNFAIDTDASNFINRIAAFRLNGKNVWEELRPEDRRTTIWIR